LLYFLQKFLPRVFGELPPGRFDGLFSDFDRLTAIVGKTFRRLANRRAFWAIVRSIPDFSVCHDKISFFKELMARGFVPHGAIFTSGVSDLATSLLEPSKTKARLLRRQTANGRFCSS
jgi:hypothetical protein